MEVDAHLERLRLIQNLAHLLVELEHAENQHLTYYQDLERIQVHIKNRASRLMQQKEEIRLGKSDTVRKHLLRSAIGPSLYKEKAEIKCRLQEALLRKQQLQRRYDTIMASLEAFSSPADYNAIDSLFLPNQDPPKD